MPKHAHSTLRMRWSVVVRCNRPEGWREHRAHWVVKLAQRLDGRWHLAVAVQTQPAISRAAVDRCLDAGLDAGRRLIGKAVRAEAVEHVLRSGRPDLYGRENV